MKSRFISLVLVLVMCSCALFVISSDDSAADEGMKEIKIYSDNSGVSYTADPIVYSYSDHGDYFFSISPEQLAKDIIAGTKSFSDVESDPAHVADPIYNESYYVLSKGLVDQRYGVPFIKLSEKPETIYIPAGTYSITCEPLNDDAESTIDGKSIYLYQFGMENYNAPYFDKGKGTVKVNVSGSYYFCIEYYDSDRDWTKLSLKYSISPLVDLPAVTDFENTMTVGLNKYWVKFAGNDPLTGRVSTYSHESTYYFIRDSDDEKQFVKNIVEKNKADGSAYYKDLPQVFGEYVNGYVLVDMTKSNSSPNYMSAYDSESRTDSYSDVTITKYNATSSFYGPQSFSIAVDFDTSKYNAVVIKSNNLAIWMEAGKLYSVNSTYSNDYDIFLVPSSETEDLTLAEIKVYSEGLSPPDNNGTVFAVVCILLCVFAFGILINSGRRTKWGESAGLEELASVSEDVPAEESVEKEE